jgi:hypothetical protein
MAEEGRLTKAPLDPEITCMYLARWRFLMAARFHTDLQTSSQQLVDGHGDGAVQSLYREPLRTLKIAVVTQTNLMSGPGLRRRPLCD